MSNKAKQYILWFKQISIKDIPLVGGKNASLGEMYRVLSKKGINISDGFAITAYAYKEFIKKAGIEKEIIRILSDLKSADLRKLQEKGDRIRKAILYAQFPPKLKEEIKKAYKILNKKYKLSNTDVAVRSSATAEDLPEASFAGQLESFLNVKGEDDLINKVKRCFASLFTNRAISYRRDKGFSQFEIAISVGVQKMVRSDKASAGVMFTIDTETGFKGAILVNSAYGLGENVVKGRINPDEFYVFKPTLKQGYNSIISKTLGSKEKKLIYYNKKGAISTKNIIVAGKDRKTYSLSDKEVLQLAKWGCMIEDYYSKQKGKFSPQDIEWAKDGLSGKIFIVQARPETIHAPKEGRILKEYVLLEKGRILCKGSSIGIKIGQGKARVIKNVREINKFVLGEVLVAKMTDPDWEPIMMKASAIITDSGGRTCHAAIVSRELGVPCIVGTISGTKKIKTGQSVTISCAEGEEGKVYQGLLKFKVKETDLTKIKKPKTKIMMNVGDPRQAFAFSFIPNDGVGLAREEFIFTNFIKIHPLALIDFHLLKDLKIKKQIASLTHNYKNKTQFLIDRLAEGIGCIAAAFYPKDVIVRTSDFKTNEYAGLIGGKEYEPEEENPMIGWRGASRYYDEKFKKAFALECQALRKVREVMGFVNVKIMIPFCRTIDEGKKVLRIMEANGLRKRKKKLEVYVMCEIPSNIILAKEFSKIFDGFSIGTNDLTQLVLGLDRDSALVSGVGDERNEAVKRMLKQVIKEVHKCKRKIGVCGQAPSDFPNFANFLVKCGIDSISLNPDSVLKTTIKVLKIEKKLNKK